MVDHSAVLVVRVWVEDGMESFRGRLTTVKSNGEDGGTGDRTFAVATSPGDVVGSVREWLESFERAVTNRVDGI